MSENYFDLIAKFQEGIENLNTVLLGDESASIDVDGVAKPSITKEIKDKFTELQIAQRSGVIAFRTYAALDAYTPTIEQQTASFKVTNDANHALNGYYSWVSATAYTKDADLVVNTIDEFNTSDAVSGKAVSLYSSIFINGGITGLSEKYPNLYLETTGEGLSDDTRWTSPYGSVSLINGMSALTSQGVTRLDITNIAESFPSGFISAGALWLRKPANSSCRQLILQYDVDGVEIERDTLNILFSDSWDETTPRWYESAGVVLNPLAAKVSHYFDGGGTLTKFYMADGTLKGFRKPASLLPAQVTANKQDVDYLKNISLANRRPNILIDSGISNLESWTDSYEILSARWDDSINKMVLDITTGNSSAEAKFNMYPSIDLVGETEYSWQFVIAGKSIASTGIRFLVVQYAGEVELHRDEHTSAKMTSSQVGDLVKFESVPILVGCDKITCFISTSKGYAGEVLSLTDLCLRGGNTSRHTETRPPVVITSQQNLFPDYTYVNGEPYGSAYTALENGVPKLKIDNTQSEGGFRWYLDAVDALAQGSKVFFSISSILTEPNPSGANGFSLDVLYRNSVGAEISRTQKTQISFDTIETIGFETIIPADTVVIEVRPSWRGTAGNAISGELTNLTVSKFNPSIIQVLNTVRPFYSPPVSPNIMYVSSVGNDENDGTFASPVASFNHAAELLNGRGIIKVIDDGYYPEQVILSANAIDLIVSGDGFNKPHIRGGERKTNWSLEAGETNLWFTASNDTNARFWIWEGFKNDESTIITDDEREVAHKGKTHRLEHTKLYKKADLTALKLADHGYWYDDVNGNLYVKPANVYADFEADAWITYSSARGLVCSAVGSITLMDLVVDFSGVDVSASANAELFNVESIGSSTQGLSGYDTRGKQYGCRWAGADNDGQNFHNTIDVDILGTVFYNNDSWCHDNGDDGTSMHEHCVAYYNGGLYEYNQDRGCAPAYGAHVVFKHVKTKYNGYLQADTSADAGEGIALIGANAEADSVGTSVECFNCIDIGSMYSFASHGAAHSSNNISVMKLYNCVSESARVAAYSAKRESILELNDCSELNTVGVVKRTETGGIITVKNTSQVV